MMSSAVPVLVWRTSSLSTPSTSSSGRFAAVPRSAASPRNSSTAPLSSSLLRRPVTLLFDRRAAYP